MTALTEFERLEAQAEWRATPDARLREVVVSLGDATLTLFDPKSEAPLSHWSLPAVTRLNPGQMPAIYTPHPQQPDEQLEIDDPLMIEAIDRVQRAIARHRAHPGRLRGGLTLLAVLLMIAGLIFWLPDALIRHAARVAPPAQARAIGDEVLAEIARSTGAVCDRASGQTVLDWLAPQLLPSDASIRAVPSLAQARRLPGNLFVLGSDLVAASGGAEAVAGHLLAAVEAETDTDVLLAALTHAGPKAALRLLTLGSLPQDSLTGYGEKLLLRQPARPDDERLLARFSDMQLGSSAYAWSLDSSGESVLTLIEADPMRGQPPIRPLLTPPQWAALQQICSG